MLDEKVFVNAVVGLHATGGSTNHTLHLVAMAAAAGITLTWDDFSDLAEKCRCSPRVYPNGKADVTHFTPLAACLRDPRLCRALRPPPQ